MYSSYEELVSPSPEPELIDIIWRIELLSKIMNNNKELNNRFFE